MSDKLFYDFRPMAEAITTLERRLAELTRRVDALATPDSGMAQALAQAEADIADLKAIVQQHWAEIQQAAKKGGDVEVRVGSNWGHGHGATGKIL
jgi:predicted  nucleic acid-binding Zn-ribbon protein